MRIKSGYTLFTFLALIGICGLPYTVYLADKDKTRQGRNPQRAVSGTVGKTGAPAAVKRQEEPNQAQVLPDGSMIGKPQTGALGITESVAQIMERDRQRANLPRMRPSKVEFEVERENLPSAPGAPEVSSWPPQPRALAADGDGKSTSDRTIVPLAPQTVSTPNFNGASLADTGAFPPDTMGAVGPTQFIVAVNGRIRSFDKTTGAADGALNADMDVFFSSVISPPIGGNPIFTSDPRIRYDRLTGRWFVIIIDVPCANGTCSSIGANRVLIAVSNGSTITNESNFTFYFFQISTTNFTDYPTLGIDNNALYIGGNMFSTAGAFVGCDAAVVRKSSLLGGGPIVFTNFNNITVGTGAGLFTPQGVDNYDPAATEGYFIGVDNAVFSLLVVRRVSNPGGTPTLSANLNITVPTTTFPNPVTHLGNTGGNNGRVDSLGDRLYAAHLRDGRLWTAHNIRVSAAGVASTAAQARNATRWYELQNLTTTPSLRQAGTVFDSTANLVDAQQYWIPSVMVSGQGHAALGFSAAGTNFRIDAATVGRLATDTLGTTQGPPVRYTASSTAYNPPADPGGTSGRRWGDYSYTSLDPLDDMTMWTIQQYCDATNSYGVRAVRLLAPAPTITPCGTATDVTQGATANINITGTGFYDPPASLSGRIPISASVGGTGVTVNSVTFNSATSVTVNVTVSGGAATGARTITITNPDGQQVATASCLNITSAGTTVTSINRAGSDPVCTGSSAAWTVTFSQAVTGVTASNFSLIGGTGATITNVTGSGTTWTVTASTGTAATTLGLNMVNATGITPTVTNLPFTGQTYTVNAPPGAVTASNNGPVNIGQALSLDATVVAGASYAWTGPNGFTSSIRNPSIPSAQVNNSGVYTVTVTTGGCAPVQAQTTALVRANAQVTQNVATTQFNAAAPPPGFVGTFTINTNLTNTGGTAVGNNRVFYRVATLEKVGTNANTPPENRLLVGGNPATPNNGLVGSEQDLDLTIVGNNNGFLDPGETVPVTFTIGLGTRESFRFFVDLFGITPNSVNPTPLGRFQITVDESQLRPTTATRSEVRLSAGNQLLIGGAGVQSSPTLAVDAVNPLRAVVAATDFATNSVAVMVTGDGGATWRPLDVGLTFNGATYSVAQAPSAAWVNGELQVAFVAANLTNSATAIVLARSTDGLRFNQFQILDQVAAGTPVALMKPTTAGGVTTWSRYDAATRTTTVWLFNVGGQRPVRLQVATGDEPTVTTFRGQAFIGWTDTDGRLLVARFDGLRLSTPVEVARPGITAQTRIPALADRAASANFTLAVDDRGTLYGVYTGVGNGLDVFLTRSTDNGATWSRPVVVNDATAGDQFLPAISTTGGVFVSWSDTKLDSSRQRADRFSAGSKDGETFGAAQRVSTVSSNTSRSNPTRDYTFNLGTRAGIGGTLVVWTDNRGGNEDVYISRQ